MANSFLNLDHNLAGGLHKSKSKESKSRFEHKIAKNDFELTFKCVDCNKKYEKKLDKDLFK